MIVSQFLAQNPAAKAPFVGEVSMLVQVTSIEPSIFPDKLRVDAVILDDAGTGVAGQTVFRLVTHDQLARHFSPDGKQWMTVEWRRGDLRLDVPR